MTKLTIERIIHLLYAPKKRVRAIPQTMQIEAISRFLSLHEWKSLENPTRSESETKKSIEDSVNKTENFLKFKMNNETIDKIPANIAHIPVMTNPIILSEYASDKVLKKLLLFKSQLKIAAIRFHDIWTTLSAALRFPIDRINFLSFNVYHVSFGNLKFIFVNHLNI